jgi:hypothetical protein
MMSSLIPSEKISCSGSPLIFSKGSTAIAGRPVNGKRDSKSSRGSSGVGPAGASDRVMTAPTKRNPLGEMVRISFCSSPLSPIALRAALIRPVRVESDTIRPPHTEAMRSSLLTTRPRFCTRSKTLRLDGDRRRATAQLARVRIERVIGEEKLHVLPRTGSPKPLSTNNQTHLTDKSSVGQSLSAALPTSSSVMSTAGTRTVYRCWCRGGNLLTDR